MMSPFQDFGHDERVSNTQHLPSAYPAASASSRFVLRSYLLILLASLTASGSINVML